MSEQETPMNHEGAEAPQMSHEEAMARKHLEANPKDIPAQFGGDVDKFMDSWKEQRAALTRTQQELAEVKKSIHEAPTPGLEEAPAAPAEGPDSLVIPEQETVSAAPEDLWANVEQEFVSTGDISEATRERLAEMNVPAQVVDGYLNGIRAQQAESAAAAAQSVGGPEVLQSIIDWSSKNLTAEEREATNAALQSPGWEYTLLGLKSRMEAANPARNEPTPGPKVSGQIAPQVTGYHTSAEMTAAIRDSRYGIDQQYTEHVQNRIRATRR